MFDKMINQQKQEKPKIPLRAIILPVLGLILNIVLLWVYFYLKHCFYQ